MSGTLLDEGQVRYIVEGIKEVITASSNRRTERTERANAEDFDSEEDELLREENEQEDEIFDQVSLRSARLQLLDEAAYQYLYF